MGQVDTCVHLGGRLMLKSIPPPIRPPLTPPSASLMPHLPGYPECRVRRSGAPPLLRNVPRRAAEVPLPAAPRHVRQNRGAGAMYYVWEMGTGSVLDHEVLKLVKSINLLFILLSENRPKKGLKTGLSRGIRLTHLTCESASSSHFFRLISHIFGISW